MITIKQCKDNAYAINVILNSNLSFDRAVISINNICDLNVNKKDLQKIIKLRAEYFKFDLIFL